MKFIAIRSNLKDGIASVQGASGENLNLPILKNILLETEENKVKITATNLEIAITAFVAGKVIQEGKFTVPAGVFANLINNIQSERLNLEEKKGKLEVKTDNYEATIQGLSAADFPITPKVKNQAEYIEIKAEVLKDSLSQVLIAAQFSDLRPELNTVFFHYSVNNIKIVATDSFRLAEQTIAAAQFQTTFKKEFEILIPLKTAQELFRILHNEDVVRIYHDENQVLFKTARFELLSRLVEGKFPDYTAIIPKKFNVEIVFSRQEFMNALKLAGIFGSKNSEVKLKSEEGKKSIEIVSSDQTLGENNYLLAAKVQGKLDAITFNWRYLMDALKVLKNDEVFFGINSDNEPAEIKPVGDASYVYILKPIAGE